MGEEGIGREREAPCIAKGAPSVFRSVTAPPSDPSKFSASLFTRPKDPCLVEDHWRGRRAGAGCRAVSSSGVSNHFCRTSDWSRLTTGNCC